MDRFTIPTKYRIEIHQDSFRNDPEIAFHSSGPFLPISVGDEIDPACWSHGHPTEQGKVFKVIGIRHLLMDVVPTHNTHSLSVLVKLVDKS